MSDHQPAVARHYGRGGLLDRILAALADAGKDVEHLTVDDLAPVDEFHGRQFFGGAALAGGAHLQRLRVPGSRRPPYLGGQRLAAFFVRPPPPPAADRQILLAITKSVFRLAARRTICPRGLPSGIRAGK